MDGFSELAALQKFEWECLSASGLLMSSRSGVICKKKKNISVGELPDSQGDRWRSIGYGLSIID